ncbi:exosortase/archaeosortase family protein [Marinobacter halodurans]|uniref:Exosortase/archaeosortase family protein n=1 Tax=Marinobacter halodurans TaxID=2528979 RepID=A0ABY1ZFX4_9GAMM|nr:exosortase [Marinobacter halodurans]TBW50179.1 exosortase/archaeosortase family protein [Marinobacter halodurans]
MDRGNAVSRISIWSPLVFLGAFIAGTYPILAGIAERWVKWDEAYSHGIILLLVCLYLTFQKLRRVRPVAGFYWPWLVPLVLSAILYGIGGLLRVEALQQVMLLPILFSGLLVQWGWRQTIPFLIPIGLIVFAIPFWDYLAWYLQLITVAVNQFFLSQLGINFVVEGVFVYFPGIGAFEIAHGCSGLRYLLVGLTLTFLYSELNLVTLRARVTLIAVGVFLALVANWVRVFVIIHTGYATRMTSSLVNHHDTFGWWVFAATLVPLFVFARWLEKREGAAAKPAGPDADASKSGRASALAGLSTSAVPLMLLAIAFWPGTISKAGNMATHVQYRGLEVFDSSQWLPLFGSGLARWHPIVERPDRSFEQTYVQRGTIDEDGRQQAPHYFVGLYSYDHQRQGGEVVQYGNRLYDGEGFVPSQAFDVGGAEPIMSGVTISAHDDATPIYLAYAYYVEGRWETNELQAKLAQLPGALNRRTDASLLVVAVRCDDCDGQADLETIAPDIRSRAQRYLDGVYLKRD